MRPPLRLARDPARGRYRPSFSRPAARTSIVCTTGVIRPAAAPCSARKATRLPKSRAWPDSADPTVNSSSEPIHTGLSPKRSVAQPLTGTTTARASRWPCPS